MGDGRGWRWSQLLFHHPTRGELGQLGTWAWKGKGCLHVGFPVSVPCSAGCSAGGANAAASPLNAKPSDWLLRGKKHRVNNQRKNFTAVVLNSQPFVKGMVTTLISFRCSLFWRWKCLNSEVIQLLRMMGFLLRFCGCFYFSFAAVISDLIWGINELRIMTR